MQLKTKLTLSIAGLVLLVVLAVNWVYLAEGMRQQLQVVYTHADFLSREIYNQMNQELAQAQLTGAGGEAIADAKPTEPRPDSPPAPAATPPAAPAAAPATPGAPAVSPERLGQFLTNLRQSPAMQTLFSSAIGYNGSIRDVALVAPDGAVAMDSNPLLDGQPQPRRPAMGAIMQAGLWRQMRAVLGPETIYSVDLATQVGNQPLATITVGVDTVLLRETMLGRMRHLLFYGGLIVLLATGLAWSLAELALSPLAGISTQLDLLVKAGTEGEGHGDEFGRVRSKIERLGQQIEDTRQIYSTLQENVGQVLGGLEEGLLLFDAHGTSVMASAATPRMLGLPAPELVGQTVEALFPGSSGLDRSVRQAVRMRQPLNPREAERHAGGRPLLARLDVVRDSGGQPGTLLTLRDAEPVHRLEGELELARRLSAVGRLTRGVAHEVKNPLNAMAIHLHLLREKADAGGGALLPHIQVIGREIERLDRVVRTFLDFSRPVELKLQALDLSEVVRGVAQLVRAGAEASGIAVVLVAPLPGPQVWLDRDLAEQMLLNLVNNGLQAMETGAAGAPRQLRLEVFEQDQQAAVRVRDFGPGIAAEHRDKIFDLYFTTRAEGTGIGLALAARIMQLHHGAIELEPETGAAGASFLLLLPLRQRGGAHAE